MQIILLNISILIAAIFSMVDAKAGRKLIRIPAYVSDGQLTSVKIDRGSVVKSTKVVTYMGDPGQIENTDLLRNKVVEK